MEPADRCNRLLASSAAPCDLLRRQGRRFPIRVPNRVRSEGGHQGGVHQRGRLVERLHIGMHRERRNVDRPLRSHQRHDIIGYRSVASDVCHRGRAGEDGMSDVLPGADVDDRLEPELSRAGDERVQRGRSMLGRVP